MGNFKEDLKKGKEMEIKAMNILNKNGFNLIQNPNEKEMDLLILEHGIEIKFDEYAIYSGNFYIEFECNGKPSGIFREEKINLKYWGHSDGKQLFLLSGDKFKKWVLEKIQLCRLNKTNVSSKGGKTFRVIENGGNGGRTKGLLVPVEEIKKQADFIYKL